MTKESEQYYRRRNERMREEIRVSVTAQEQAVREAARKKQAERLRILREAQGKANKGSKYHNRKTSRIIDGEVVQFDSEHEARRWDELVLLQKAGKITDLKRQVRYKLIPAQRDLQGHVIEKACDYVADFSYYEKQDGMKHPVHVVEDAKGVRTPDYVIKRKLMLQKYGVRIREV